MSAVPTKSKSVPPVPLERLEQIVSDACKLTFADVEAYEHPKTRQWNQEIIDYILQTVVAEATPEDAKHPPFKFFVNSTIVQHQTSAGRPARLSGTTHPSGAPAPIISTIGGLPGTNTRPTAPAGDVQKNEALGTQTELTAAVDVTNIKNELTSSTAAAAAESGSIATNTDPTTAADGVSSRMSNLTISADTAAAADGADHRASTWTTNTLVNTGTVPPHNLSENTPRINATEAPSADGGPGGSRPGPATQPRPSVVGRRGIHSATRGYWDESTDGMWSYKYEGDQKGLDVIIMFLWIGL